MVIENPQTGERITFTHSTPELLVMDAAWTRPGHRTIEHLHPQMEERFTVVAGEIAVRTGQQEQRLSVGGHVVVPPGVPHLAWNPTDREARVQLEMRPALRWEEFTRRLFAGDDPIALLEQYADEVALPPR